MASSMSPWALQISALVSIFTYEGEACPDSLSEIDTNQRLTQALELSSQIKKSHKPISPPSEV